LTDSKLSALSTIVPSYLYGEAGGVSGKVVPGIVSLSGGAITTPVAYIDTALPAGYAYFDLWANDIAFDIADNLVFRTSEDGGATFHTGALDYQTTTWSTLGVVIPNASFSSLTFQGHTFADIEGYLSEGTVDPAVAPRKGIVHARIYPGSNATDDLAYVHCNSSYGTTGGGWQNDAISAVVLATGTRQNVLRIGPTFGSGHNLVAVRWVVSGTPNA